MSQADPLRCPYCLLINCARKDRFLSSLGCVASYLNNKWLEIGLRVVSAVSIQACRVQMEGS